MGRGSGNEGMSVSWGSGTQEMKANGTDVCTYIHTLGVPSVPCWRVMPTELPGKGFWNWDRHQREAKVARCERQSLGEADMLQVIIHLT
jgi:hypothetical protein